MGSSHQIGANMREPRDFPVWCNDGPATSAVVGLVTTDRDLEMFRPILISGLLILLLPALGHGQEGPTKAQLDSLESGLLNPAELVIQEFMKITDESYRCRTTLVYRRAEWLTGPVWEAGWDDGDDEDFSGKWSRLDNTWIHLSYLPTYIWMTHDLSLSSQLEPIIQELSSQLDSLYRETGRGPYPQVIPWREIFGCDGEATEVRTEVTAVPGQAVMGQAMSSQASHDFTYLGCLTSNIRIPKRRNEHEEA